MSGLRIEASTMRRSPQIIDVIIDEQVRREPGSRVHQTMVRQRHRRHIHSTQHVFKAYVMSVEAVTIDSLELQ